MMTFIYERVPYLVKVSPQTKNELPSSRLSKVIALHAHICIHAYIHTDIQRDRQTDRHTANMGVARIFAAGSLYIVMTFLVIVLINHHAPSPAQYKLEFSPSRGMHLHLIPQVKPPKCLSYRPVVHLHPCIQTYIQMPPKL